MRMITQEQEKTFLTYLEQNMKVELVFKKSNVEDLKNVLYNMLSNDRIEKEEISDYVLDKYNWDSIVELTEKIYSVSEIKITAETIAMGSERA